MKIAQAERPEIMEFDISSLEGTVESEQTFQRMGSGLEEIGPVMSLISGAQVLAMLLASAAVIALMVVWVVQLVQVIRRQDLKEHKIIWVLLLIFVPVIGMIVYPFVEGRKRLGIWTLALMSVPIISLILWTLMRLLVV